VNSSYVHEIYPDLYWSKELSMRFDGPCEKVEINPLMLLPCIHPSAPGARMLGPA
jgi:hypothetical protein